MRECCVCDSLTLTQSYRHRQTDRYARARARTHTHTHTRGGRPGRARVHRVAAVGRLGRWRCSKGATTYLREPRCECVVGWVGVRASISLSPSLSSPGWFSNGTHSVTRGATNTPVAPFVACDLMSSFARAGAGGPSQPVVCLFVCVCVCVPPHRACSGLVRCA